MSHIEPPKINTPMYNLVFMSKYRPNENICFHIECVSLVTLGDMIRTELSVRVIAPEDWILCRLDRFMFSPHNSNPTEAFEKFQKNEDDPDEFGDNE